MFFITGSIRRFATVLLGLFVMLGALSPAIASANTFESTSRSGDRQSNSGTVQAVVERPCIDKDFDEADHHDEESTAEKAKAWEKGARKHARAGNHESAAGAYKMAACLWDSISEFEKAEAAYEKAAEQYDQAAEAYEKAGDKEKAAAAREKAKEIREMLD